jgi:ankyrin repeat protein
MSASSDPVFVPVGVPISGRFQYLNYGDPIIKLGYIAANLASEDLEVLLKNIDLSRINACAYNNKTALWHAAAYGRVENVRLLLSKGADVNTFCKDKETALMAAAFTATPGSDEVVRLLLEKKPDMTLKDNQGKTALDIVRERSAKIQNPMFERKLQMIKDNTPGASGGKRRRLRLNATRRKRTQKKKGSRSK